MGPVGLMKLTRNQKFLRIFFPNSFQALEVSRIILWWLDLLNLVSSPGPRLVKARARSLTKIIMA